MLFAWQENAMAALFGRKSSVMGKAIPVDNKDRRWGENGSYLAVKVEDETGGKEEWLLFTEKELECPTLFMGAVTDSMKAGRMFPCVTGGARRLAVKLETGGASKVVLLCHAVVERARRRAEKNLEDIPRQTLIGDILD